VRVILDLSCRLEATLTRAGLPRTSYPALALMGVFGAAGLFRLRGPELAAFVLVPVLGAAGERLVRKRRGAAASLDGTIWAAAAGVTGCTVFSGVLGLWLPVLLSAAALVARFTAGARFAAGAENQVGAGARDSAGRRLEGT